MIQAPLPVDERERLAALRAYGVLDTPPEERFDRLTRLVARHLGVSISLVSLVDSERQWFKSAVGLAAKETPRTVAFCAHAILTDEPLVVENAFEDERFADNPLVLGQPNVCFYAGAPLITAAGYRLGTLCAIDSEPRSLTPSELEFLRDLAAVAVDEMELSAASTALEEHALALEEQNGLLNAFVHSLSHDLAGPVGRIRSFCEFLHNGDDLPLEECLEHIEHSAFVADRLIRDLRSYVGLTRHAAMEECSVAECFQDAREVLDLDLEAAGARLDVGPLPDVLHYPGLLTTLFTNLLSNAVKYRAERPLEVTVRCEDRGSEWEFSFADNGIGIEEEYLAQVFDLLVRLHSDEIPGSGLGLAICQKIVRHGGGEIHLTSTAGEGTTVTFTLQKSLAPATLPAV